MDIAEIKYDAIAELSGSSESPSPSTATKTTSDGGDGGGGGGGKPRKEVPRNPQTQPDNVCFYRVRVSNMLLGKINPSKVGVALLQGLGWVDSIWIFYLVA